MTVRRSEHGFSLAELMISMAIMLVIAGAATSALLRMTSAQATIWNRTQMHSGIRGATEVLQQEVGQAGRIAIPNTIKLTAGVTGGTAAQTVAISCTSTCTGSPPISPVTGIYQTVKLVVDGSTTQETVTVTGVDSTANTITAIFKNNHAANASVRVLGAFASGVVPPEASPSSYTNGSNGSVLKLYGDINADGNMVYVEYTCDTTAGNLYRNSVTISPSATKTQATASQILLSNITTNPDLSPCFTYQIAAINGRYFVTDVAITLTVQTQLVDPVTKQFQKETKALLNVSQRNVFNVWTVASLGITERIQEMPAIVTALLPCPWRSGGVCS